MSPRAERWVGMVQLAGTERQNLGPRNSLMAHLWWVRRVEDRSRWSLRSGKMQHFSEGLKRDCALCLQLLKCPYLSQLKKYSSEQWKCYQLGHPREISSICGYVQKNTSQGKFLFGDHGIRSAFWGSWCSHLLVVCLKFQFGPALGSDKRGRTWCCPKVCWHETTSGHLRQRALLCPCQKWEEEESSSGEPQDSRLLRWLLPKPQCMEQYHHWFGGGGWCYQVLVAHW